MTENLVDQLASLTDEQRALLELRLRRTRRAGPPAPEGLPLSFTQEQLWFLDRLDPGNPAYDIPLALRLSGPLDRAALDGALAAVVDRHDALRAVVVDRPDGPPQRVRPRVAVPLPVVDLTNAPDPAAAARARAGEHAAYRFDLTAGPLLAAELLELGPREHVLLVTAHHIVFDAWSAGLLARDLAACYGAQTTGEPARLPALPVRFAEHAAAERRRLAGGELERHLMYWTETLRGAPTTSTLPPDRPRPPVQTHRGGQQDVEVPAELTERLAELARTSGVSLNAVLLTGLGLLLHRATGQRLALLGMPSAGRNGTELEALIGSFANMLVLRVDADPAASVRELVRRTHDTLRDAYAHQAAPYARVVEAVAPPRDPSRNPLFQVGVSLTEGGADEHSAGGVTFAAADAEGEATDFDLFLLLTRTGGRLTGALRYNADLYLAETAARAVDDLLAVLAAMAADPDRPVAAVPGLRRGTVAVAATFTATPIRPALEFWLGFLGMPAGAEPAGYGQVVQHLLTPSDALATVVLLRWEDWLRHRPDGDPGAVLDAAMGDLTAAITGHRRRAGTPLTVVVGPPSPRYEDAPFGRLDDRLAALCDGLPGVSAVWVEPDGASVHDERADELGHVPYTAEFFGALATAAVRPWTRLGPEKAAYAAAELDGAAAVAARAGTDAAAAADADEPVVPPRTETERALAAVWRQVLGLAELGVTTSFFRLGGHSLLATALLSRIAAELGHDVPLHAFLSAPTIEALAARIDAGTADGPAPLRRIPRAGPLPMSSTQERLWALDRLGGRTSRHNTAYAAVLRGPLDEAALRRAMAALVARHEMLRLVCAESAGRPMLVPGDGTGWDTPTLDLRDEPADERALTLREQLRTLVRAPYDLATGPLLRFRLIRTGPAEHRLLLGMHHLACDNASWGILLAELGELYGGGTLPELPVQFADFAAAQREFLASDALGPELAHWRGMLRGAPAAVDLLPDRPRPQKPSDRAGRRSDRVADAGRIRELARSLGVTPFAVLLAAYGVLLGRRAGLADLVVGVPIAGRSRPELAGVVGCCTDLLPVRLDLSGRPTARQLVTRTHRAVVEAHRHQDVPFARIVETLGLPRDPSRHPVFQCAFNLADLPETATRLAGLAVEPIRLPAAGTDFDLFLNVSPAGDGLDLDLEFRADVVDPDTAGDVLADYTTVLTGLVDAPDAPVAAGSRARVTEPTGKTTVVTVASSFPVDVAPAVGFWTGLLDLPATVRAEPPGRILRPLLDPAADADLAVLLLRWPDRVRDGLSRPAAAVALDTELHALVGAVRAFRDRSATPLVVGVLPGGDVRTDRLGRSCPDGVRVVDLAEPGDPGVVAGTWIARELRRRAAAPPGRVRYDADRVAWTELAAVVAPDRLVPDTAADAGAGDVVVDPARADRGFLSRWWLLDGSGVGDPALLTELAAELPDTAAVARAVATGYRRAADRANGAPSTPAERTLAAIWADLLDVDTIGVRDDFFELGGDSLSVVTMVSRANEAGLPITPKQAAATPTIAALAGAATTPATTTPGTTTPAVGLATGTAPLTAAQRWFFDEVAPSMSRPAWFNHPYYLRLREPLPVAVLERAVALLAEHHDALRLRIDPRGSGQEYAPVSGAVPFRSHDLSGLPDAERAAAVDRIAAAAQPTLDLAGPLARVVHFGLSPAEPDRLLVVAHHLVTDGISRATLLADLQTLCRQLARGAEPVPPARTTSYGEWARRLAEHAKSVEVAAERPFWLAQRVADPSVPVDLDGAVTFGTLTSTGRTLSTADTAALRAAVRHGRVTLSEALLWAVADVLTEWTGRPDCLVATTANGREDLLADVDLTRTTGWFQVFHPIALHPPVGAGPADAVRAVAAELRRLPRGGIGYGLLRHLGRDAELAAIRPQVTVNWMGSYGFDEVHGADELFEVCPEPLGQLQDPAGVWPFRLDVVGTVVGGRLRIDVNHGTRVHRPETARAVLDGLEASLLRLAHPYSGEEK